MSNETGNRTYNLTSKRLSRFPISQCLPWIPVLSVECLAIVIVNIITIIVFLKQHQLQRRSLYLIIHLAVVDLLVGGISGPVQIALLGVDCGLWEPGESLKGFWTRLPIRNVFPFASLINLTALSLERLHATFRPLNHRFLKKRIYYVTIAGIWFLIVITQSGPVFITLAKLPLIIANFVTLLGVWTISLLVICVSYVAIYVKLRFSRHPCSQFRVVNRERRLTFTLFIALVTSLLTSLPWGVFITVVRILGYKRITSPRPQFASSRIKCCVNATLGQLACKSNHICYKDARSQSRPSNNIS